ncbi:DNA-methyltransferase [Hugenholtzia roseola]|uniref:DNA-methyltransferase n=1 Tax=Hugenholtzia roseola TaxID=1002 RepID=UPI000407EC10|nr:site-specific DNA-methyltransferase [Hugenholtzia roseola]
MIWETENIKLLLQDAIIGMSEMLDNSFDLCIADPPYGASTKANWQYDSQKKLNGFGGNWKLTSEVWDLLSQNELFESTFVWLKEVKRLVKPTGSIWIHSTYHNSGFVNVCCQLLGLEIINEVAWYKRNAFPNLSARRLTASHETILWVHTGGEKRDYIFNYDAVKKAKFEGDNLKEQDKQLRTVWDIPNNKTKDELTFGTHPTQKPLRVSDRLLMISGLENGKLLVPFAGSGTEMIAGLKYGMQVVGFETNTEYFELAKTRIEHFLVSQKQTLFQ